MSIWHLKTHKKLEYFIGQWSQMINIQVSALFYSNQWNPNKSYFLSSDQSCLKINQRTRIKIKNSKIFKIQFNLKKVKTSTDSPGKILDFYQNFKRQSMPHTNLMIFNFFRPLENFVKRTKWVSRKDVKNYVMLLARYSVLVAKKYLHLWIKTVIPVASLIIFVKIANFLTAPVDLQ